ncbi:hypothetical protein COLO4_14882 [Corchorus olitorius]|uniref:F-box domain-containing protein n=1 Tax=Corchorus olitorius TaxID=93759 RepID=A0A1R3JQN5_9ROSI|nr:hypothetical protein COLO4_14882 [Corchorus olitorius]
MSDYINLPQELILEILVRLPVEDLVKFTAVCKSWNSLIKNPNFISTHLGKSISSSSTNRLLFRQLETDARLQYSLCLDNKALHEYKQPPCPNGGCGFGVAGSYNGLVCLVRDMGFYYGSTFILWNPAIKKAIHLPEPSVRYSSLYDAFIGFGFDSKTNDYKLLRLVVNVMNNHTEAEVYSLNANCWRRITYIAPNYTPHFEDPGNYVNSFDELAWKNYCANGFVKLAWRTYGNSFVNGSIHLLACDRNAYRILAFDVSEEVFSEIPLPDHLSNASNFICANLLKYGESSIATLTCEWEPSLMCTQRHLWVMKEYGVATSWTKVLAEAAAVSVPRVVFFRKDEEQIFLVRNEHLVVDSYVESLVLLDKCCINSPWNVISIDEEPEDDDANSTG